MKTILRPSWNTHHATLSWLALCVIILSLPTPALFAKDPVPQQAKVVYLKGKARYTSDPEKKNWKVVEKGTLIPAGATIETADNSTVDLSIQENQHRAFDLRTSSFQTCTDCTSFLRLYEKSVISFVQFRTEKIKRKSIPHIHIELRAGCLHADTRQLSPQTDHRVICPHFTAKISTAEYVAYADGKLILGLGSALLEMKDKKNSSTTITKELMAGFTYDAATDGITAIPPDQLRSFGNFEPTPHYRPPPIPMAQPPLRRGI